MCKLQLKYIQTDIEFNLGFLLFFFGGDSSILAGTQLSLAPPDGSLVLIEGTFQTLFQPFG